MNRVTRYALHGLAVVAVLSSLRGGTAQVFVEQPKLTASDAIEFDTFGYSLAIEGDLLVVGAPAAEVTGGLEGEGLVYVYRRSGNSWAEEAILESGAPSALLNMGYSVAASGDTILAGAQGNAFIFRWNGTTWTREAWLTPSQGHTLYGGVVALDGDTAVVGLQEDLFVTQPSVAYVYRRSGATWSEEARVIGADTEPDDRFAVSVAISGDTLLVGSTGNDNSLEGSAYVFVRQGSTWSQQAKLTSDSPVDGDLFGCSVALEGNIAVIGAREGNLGRLGSAYVFERSATTWSQTTRLRSGDVDTFSFGYCVSLHGDTLAVGTYGSQGPTGSIGRAYAYGYDGTTWVPIARLTQSEAAGREHFGFSIATSGTDLLVGSYHADAPGASDAGAVFVYSALPGPNIAAVTPSIVEALIPGTAETLTLEGRSFDLLTRLTFDNQEVAPERYTIVTPQRITLDLPQAAGLGTHFLAAEGNLTSDTFALTVVAPADPRYEIESGDSPIPVSASNGLTLRIAGQPGHVHGLYLSTSNLPSVAPFVHLLLGNQFTELVRGPRVIVPASAWLELTFPPPTLSHLIGLTLYSQAVDLTFPVPLASSNLQVFVVGP